LLVDQDDPEKHIVDLERWGADALGEPTDDPPRSDLAQPEKRGVLALPRPIQILLLILGLGVVLGLAGHGAYQIYAYHVGTPTMATDIHCITGSKAFLKCTGTWQVAGKSYTGTIEGVTGFHGSSLGVHVHGDKAYAPNKTILLSFVPITFVPILPIGAIVATVITRRWSGQ
jgi:hypothetical protein